MDFPILSTITFLPLVGAFMIFFIMNGEEEVVAHNSKLAALWTSLITFALSVSILFNHNYDPTSAAFQLTETHGWLPQMGLYYRMGIDGISLPFVLLTTLLTPICILVSWKGITQKVKGYMAAFLALESFVIGVFCATDLMLFYVFWEAMLIPMFLIIGVWGGERRVYAALKFFLYTFVGSVLMLIAILYLFFAGGETFNMALLPQLIIDPKVQVWLWLAFFAAFAVKVPMWPFHTWLPDAHVQAPTAGSVILAGVLLKMGAYGFLRLSLPVLPEASAVFAPMVFALSVIAIVYAALVALMQQDVKKMIAYSSVSHMGFITLGIFAATTESIQGALMQMVNHGIVSSALFMLIGVVYDRMHTRDLNRFGGLVKVIPLYSVVFVFFVMASVALPGTNSFVGEFLILVGSYSVAPTPTIFATLGVVLGAAYMLWLTKRMIFGTPETAEVQRLTDMEKREIAMFIPLVFLVLLLGLYPKALLGITEASAKNLSESLGAGYHETLMRTKDHIVGQTHDMTTGAKTKDANEPSLPAATMKEAH